MVDVLRPAHRHRMKLEPEGGRCGLGRFELLLAGWRA